MKKWPISYLLGRVGSHIHSQRDARVQVLSAPATEPTSLFRVPQGSVLVVVVQGRGEAVSDAERATLGPGDQVYLIEGESFALKSDDEANALIAQLIWMPGISG